MSEVDATLAHVRSIQAQVKVPWDRVVKSALSRESQQDCAICLCPLDITSRSCTVIRLCCHAVWLLADDASLYDSCSHVFHALCLENVERFAQVRGVGSMR